MPEDLNQPEENSRGLQVALPASDTTNIERWAIVIGISQYQHQNLNLKYAARDAEKFYELLVSPIGGSFKPEHIVKLIDRQATTANVTKALRSFLKKPGRDDLVIFYCACHGSPDLDRPENVYLLTHDTDPLDIAGSALPMGQINQSFRETLLSKRVVLFADTCHSAAIAQESGSRNIANPNDLVNRYLQEVSITRAGIALLTSAEANEVSWEDAKWGGGHGVFTYYLLKGLQGEADINQNGLVTVGELFEYVRSKVQEATDYKQHPAIGTNPFDRNLPLAIFSSSQIPLVPEESSMNLHPGSENRENTGFKWNVVTILTLGGILGGMVVAILVMYRATIMPHPAPVSIEMPKETIITSVLITSALEIHYYPQGDAETVKTALNPLGSNVVKISVSQRPPEPETNAIWFGSGVRLADIKLVATKLRQANIPIKSIKPFKNSSSKPLVIDIGADRSLPKNKTALTLEEIRDAPKFTDRV